MSNASRYEPFYTPAAIFLGGLAIALSIFFTGGLGSGVPVGSGAGPENLGAEGGEALVSVSDDPALGDPNAPVTIVEFSDFECPYCKSFFEDTLPQIKEQYIDTGKVRLVYRDLPLSFHDPAATREALAANCAREQGGDGAFFAYHDEIFARTPGNGVGLKDSELSAIAGEIGLDSSALMSCVEEERYADEVAADLVDAQNYGATGTPTFFVGLTDPSGSFTGTLINGAQPFASFQQVIDGLLNE